MVPQRIGPHPSIDTPAGDKSDIPCSPPGSGNEAPDRDRWLRSVKPRSIVPHHRKTEPVWHVYDRVRWHLIPFAIDLHSVLISLHIIFNLLRFPTVGGRAAALFQLVFEGAGPGFDFRGRRAELPVIRGPTRGSERER